MTLQITADLAIAGCKAALMPLDAGAGVSQLIIYSGAKPPAPTSALGTQTALVVFDLPNPAFGDPVETDGRAEATANPIPSVNASADGTATFFRILDGDGIVKMQGDVTAVGGGGDCELSSTSVVSGVEVIVVSLKAFQPMS